MAVDSKNKPKRRNDDDQPLQSCLKMDVNHCDVDAIRPVINESQPDEIEILLVLSTLLYDKIGSVEKDENKRNLVFKELCKHLTQRRIIGSLHQIETFRPIRERFSHTLDQLISSISRDIDRECPASVIDVRSLFVGARPTYDGSSVTLQLNLNHNKLLSYSNKIILGESRLVKEFFSHGKIEKGGFGFVYKMEKFLDKCVYAVKIIPFRFKDSTNAQKVLREVQLYAKIPQHENIVAYKSSWLDCFMERKASPIEESASSASSSSVSSHNSPSMSTNKKSTEETCVSPESSSQSVSDKPSTSNQNKQIIGITQQNKDLIPIIDRSNCFPSIHCWLCIQMELCDKNLKTWLDERNQNYQAQCKKDTDALDLIDFNKALDIFIQIVRGVNHLHSNNLIHRDLKPQNILFSQNGIVKIGDFGLTTLNSEIKSEETIMESCEIQKRTTGLGTSSYSAPEQKNSRNYNHKADIYSLGLIAFELVHPFFTAMERSLCFDNLTKEKKIPVKLLSKFNSFSNYILQMIETNPSLRPEASEILEKESLFRKDLEPNHDKPSYEDLLEKVSSLEATLTARNKEIQILKNKLKEYESEN